MSQTYLSLLTGEFSSFCQLRENLNGSPVDTKLQEAASPPDRLVPKTSSCSNCEEIRNEPVAAFYVGLVTFSHCWSQIHP